MSSISRKIRRLRIIFVYLFFMPFRIAFAIIYFILVGIFFVTFKLYQLILQNQAKKIAIPKGKTELDGISFIIPSWNKKDLLLECITSLDSIIKTEKGSTAMEIIVIDNGSTDGTDEALKQLKTSVPLVVIKNEYNRGFSPAINDAVEKAKYNYIYLLNNDMLPQEGMLQTLISYVKKLLQQKKPFFGVSSQIFFYDPEKRREESGKTYYKYQFGYMLIAHAVLDENLTEPSITGYLGGGSSLFNTYLFKQLGTFDQDTFTPLYAEDLDLSYTAWTKGFPSYFLPDSKVIHHHRSSTSKMKYDPSFILNKNILLFILKHITSSKYITLHLLEYSTLIIFNYRYVRYGWEALKKIPIIFIKKIDLLHQAEVYTDKELFDFIDFERTFTK